MLPIFTAGEFIKATRSSPQQNCVRVARRDGWTAIWDDKLGNEQTTGSTAIPNSQMLIFTDDEFDAYQHSIRVGTTEPCPLRIEQRHGTFVFTAADPTTQPGGDVKLHFDQGEFDAFVDGIRSHEFAYRHFVAT
ncbi:hypothetical protein ACIHDR_43220 [Nocardia sp. NPDC052278]|uniref:hypothetical protein n=1 Tax=unclassified Nocardia TaxID=2637762 RepID=UPI00369F3720